MNQLPTIMNKRVLLISSIFCLASVVCLSQGQLTIPHTGGNKKAFVGELIGLTKITVTYNRPGVKGREGKIWGTPVAHYGLRDMGFGSSKASPWRAGANENTTVSFSTDVKVEGKELPAGTYGLFMILGETETTVIFSKNSTSYGSFFYDPAEDALRITTNNQQMDKSVEWLKYEFIDQTDTSATLALMWERRMIPFKIEVNIHQVQLTSFMNELRTEPGFIWQSYEQAAAYCLQNDIALDQGLIWAEQAISSVVGQRNFKTLHTKADILVKLNRNTEAEALMKEAVQIGNMMELHEYAKTLLTQKRVKHAFDVFKQNYHKNPNLMTTNIGLARGYSATVNYKKAIPYLKSAVLQVPNPSSKTILDEMIKKLQEGKDIN
jgi:tetratricopeptide (TPR) repeat protein